MKKILALVLALCMVLALCACGSTSSASTAASETAAPAADAAAAPAEEATAYDTSVSADLTVGTGGEAGTYYAFTGILGQVVSNASNVQMTIVSTGGSKANIVGIDEGMYDLATVQSDVMTYAYNGTGSFEDGAITSFRTLCAMYPETVQIVTFDSEIKSVSDLKGKSVCVGDVGSGTYFNALDVFAAYDMTMDDINVVYQSFGDSVDSMLDGQIDAAFVCAGAPTSAVAQGAAQKPIYVLSFDDEHMAKLLENPMYAKFVIPAGTYEGFDEDATTVTVKATLICRADLPDDVAYTIVKTIFENTADITSGHSKGEYLALDFATDGIAVPYAKGAAAYFAENGITVDTVD